MKLFIWDFHGVLEKGNDDAVLEITNLALARHGYTRGMTREEGLFLAGQRWHEYFAFLLPKLEEESHFNLQSTCFEISKHQPEIIAQHIQLNDHADFVLEAIQSTSHHQILISNTMPHFVDMFVELVGIEKYFPKSHRFGADTDQQKKTTKKECLEKFLKDKNYFKTIISIGDSPGDMALTDHDNKLQGVGYLYSHPMRPHRPAKCDYRIHDLRAVLQEIPTASEQRESIGEPNDYQGQR